MDYEGNPKHKEPWQPGRRGSLCPKEMAVSPQLLLEGSELVGSKRYNTCGGKAFCAQEHSDGKWHGFPVGWKEVPAKLRIRWIEQNLLTRRDIQRYWETHDG